MFYGADNHVDFNDFNDFDDDDQTTVIVGGTIVYILGSVLPILCIIACVMCCCCCCEGCPMYRSQRRGAIIVQQSKYKVAYGDRILHTFTLILPNDI